MHTSTNRTVLHADVKRRHETRINSRKNEKNEKNWQVWHEAQQTKKMWEDKHKRGAEATMQRLRAADLKTAATTCKTGTGTGSDGFSTESAFRLVQGQTLDWSKDRTTFCEELESAGIWPLKASTKLSAVSRASGGLSQSCLVLTSFGSGRRNSTPWHHSRIRSPRAFIPCS